MNSLRLMYRDVDRTPYLYVLRDCALQLGLQVELVRHLSSSITGAPNEDWAELLNREVVDFLVENYWGLQSYRQRGYPFVTVAANVDRFTDKLLVRPGVSRVEELRHTRLAVRPTGPSALFPSMWLEDNGLAGDVEEVVIPESETGRWGHWKAVASGICDACFMSPLYEGPARDAGLSEVPIDPYPFAGGNVTATTTEHIAASKQEAIQQLVDAMQMANDTFRTNPAAVVRVICEDAAPPLREHFTFDAGLPERFHRVLRDELAERPFPTAAGINNAHRIRFRTNPELRDFNPLLMWDFSFARRSPARRAI